MSTNAIILCLGPIYFQFSIGPPVPCGGLNPHGALPLTPLPLALVVLQAWLWLPKLPEMADIFLDGIRTSSSLQDCRQSLSIVLLFFPSSARMCNTLFFHLIASQDMIGLFINLTKLYPSLYEIILYLPVRNSHRTLMQNPWGGIVFQLSLPEIGIPFSVLLKY